MAIKIQSIQEAVKDSGLKALVHSMAGLGKTVLCATAEEPTLIISAEAGLLSLNQNPEVLIGKGSPNFAPHMCQVVQVTTIDELQEVYDMLESQIEDRQYSWVALDSITEIAEVVLANESEKSPDPRKAYSALQITVLKILKGYRDLPHYNVIMTCKQKTSKDEESGVVSFIPMMPGQQLHHQIPYLFDEVFCLRIGHDDDGKPFHYIQATPDYQYHAKDRSGALSEMEPPSLKMIKDKIEAAAIKHPLSDEEAETAYENSMSSDGDPDPDSAEIMESDEVESGQCDSGEEIGIATVDAEPEGEAEPE